MSNPTSATFAHLDLAHIVGAVSALLRKEALVSSFESLDRAGWAAHQRSLQRGVTILEVSLGALVITDEVRASLLAAIAEAESSIELLDQWLVPA